MAYYGLISVMTEDKRQSLYSSANCERFLEMNQFIQERDEYGESKPLTNLSTTPIPKFKEGNWYSSDWSQF